jgi:hypothetical protein
MAIFIGIHRIGHPVEEDQMLKSWETYKEAAIKRGLKPMHANYNAEKGVAMCETDANSADEVRLAHEDIKLVPQEIIEVKTAE